MIKVSWLVTALLLIAISANSKEPDKTLLLSGHCQNDQSGWQTWRDEQIADLFVLVTNDPGFGDKRFLDIPRMTEKAKVIHTTIEKCAESSPDNNSVLANLKNFTANLSRVKPPDHLFGYTITDEEYVAYAQPYIELPPLLISQPFLHAVSDPATYHIAYDMITQMNSTLPMAMKWQPLIYDSQFLTTPDNTTYGRFFVHVPDKVADEFVDKWIQFGIVTPDAKKTKDNTCPDISKLPGATICSLSIVSVRADSEGDGTQVYLMDFRRKYNQDGTIEVNNNIAANGLTVSCAYCHKSPVLPIHPAQEYRFDGATLVAETDPNRIGVIPALLNSKIQHYGPPYFGDFFDPMHYGPGIGPVIQRSAEFLSACAGESGLQAETLNDLMSCENCHNGSLLGVINFPQAAYTSNDLDYLQLPDNILHPLLERYVNTGLMPLPPPHPKLKLPQKEALVNCLMTEYFDYRTQSGLLIDWLKDQ